MNERKQRDEAKSEDLKAVQDEIKQKVDQAKSDLKTTYFDPLEQQKGVTKEKKDIMDTADGALKEAKEAWENRDPNND